MKNIFLGMLLGFLSALNASGQFYTSPAAGDSMHFPYWVRMVQDPNANFYETQRAFEKYWAGRDDFRGNGWKAFKRWEYINKFRVGPDGRLPQPDAVATEYNEYLNDHQILSPNGNWTELGPTLLPANATSQPNGMGRVNNVAFHPTIPNVFYAGAPSGGLWKTTDGGSSWIPLTVFTPTLGVSALLIHPVNVDFLLLGTGDRDHGDAPGLGVYKSLDGGSSWSPSNTGMGNVTVGMLIRHPGNPDVILAATSNGIYKSIDGGSTWTVKSANNFHYKDIRFKPGDPMVVYATAFGEFYRSADNGETWTLITSGILTGSRIVIGVSPNQPGYVYLLQTNGPFTGLMRSTDSGLTFTTRSTSPNIMDYSCDGSGTSSQAWYDLCIAVDPANADILYTGGVNIWKSTDGGATWTINSHWVGSSWGYGCAPSVHADIHSLDFSPVNGFLYSGTDGGVYYTVDGGSGWNDISSGLAIAQVYKIGQSATNSVLTINGYQDNGTSQNISANFTTVIGGDGMECIIDYTNQNFRYGELYYGNIRRSNGSGYSTIAANGYYGITESGGWVTPYILHEADPATMFVGYKNVWRSNNVKDDPAYLVSWTQISSYETVNCDVLEQSPANPDILYVTRGSEIKRTDDANGSNPVWVTLTSPAANEISDLEAHPSNQNIVYATCGTKIYKSTDKGNTWSDISGTLPNIYINCLVFDITSNEGIYIGNQTGVFYKNGLMSDWSPFNTGLPTVDVRELEIWYDNTNPLGSKLKAATYGRGLWESDLNLSDLFAVTPAERSVGPMGDTTSFYVFSSNAWSASSSHSWCTVTPSGTGDDTLKAMFTSNIGSTPRTALITVTGLPGDTARVSVTQTGLRPPEYLQASVNFNDVHLSWNAPLIGELTNLIFDDGTAENGWALNPGYIIWLGNEFPVASSVSGKLYSFQLYFQANSSSGGEQLTIDVYNSDHVLIGSSASFIPPDENWITVTAGNIPFSGPFYAMVKWNNNLYSTNWLGADENGSYAAQNLAMYYDGTTWTKLSEAAGTNPMVLMIRAKALLDGDQPVVITPGEPVTDNKSINPEQTKKTLTSHAEDGSIVNHSEGDAATFLNASPDFEPALGNGVSNSVPGLMGYNIFRNGIFINFNSGANSTGYDNLDVSPGVYDYLVTAKYDLAPYGFPGQFGESTAAGPVQVMITDTITIGSGVNPSYYPYTTYWGAGRTQMLYKASELIAARLSAGAILSVGFNVIANSSQTMSGFNVKIGHTSQTTLNAWADNLTICYNSSYAVPGTGWHDIPLSTPFIWNGTSNIVVEVCYAGDIFSTNSPVYGSLVPGGIRGHYQDNNQEECSQVLSNTNSATPRPNIRFIVSSVVVDPENNVVGPESGTAGFSMQTTGAWTATSPASWCTVTPSGYGNGTITAAFTENLSAASRSANITITTGGSVQYQVTLTQGGAVPPTNLQGYANFQSIYLNWNAPAGNSGLTGYNVYRHGVKLNLSPVMNTTYTDTGLMQGVYKYTVTAIYGTLESQHAGPVIVVTGPYLSVGSGANPVGYPYYTLYMGSRTQMLYPAADIIAAGATAGNFYSVGFDISIAKPQVMQNFTIKMGSTTAATLTGWIPSVMNTVYAANYSVPGTGWRDIDFTTPFSWDGTSNVVVEICYGDNGVYTNNSVVLGTTVTGRTWHIHADNYAGCSGSMVGAAQTVTPNVRFKIDTSHNVPLQPPINLLVTNTNNDVQVSWQAPVPGSDLIGYYLYRNNIQITPVPVSSLSFYDQDLANGVYSYTVTSVYPTGESVPAGPGIATISLATPPVRLIAGTGFKNCIPLNWSAPAGDNLVVEENSPLGVLATTGGDAPNVADFYNIYRRTGAAGTYTLIGNTMGFGTFNPTSCYVDHSAETGISYFYKVTAYTGGVESNFSNEVSAISSINGFEKNAAYSESPPVIDGIINPVEWIDATMFPITNTLGVFNLPPSQTITAYYKKVGNYLYIAVKDLADVTNNGDELGIYFDNNSNQIFDGTDGNIWLDRITDTSVSVRYRRISGSFPFGITFVTIVDNPVGITGAVAFNGGHREFEIKIDLLNSPLKPENNSFGNYLYSWDASNGYTGYWPGGLVWAAPETYARMNVFFTPAAAPVTHAATVNAIENSLVGVPVTVNGFTDITVFNLKLQYNPNVIAYAGFANVATGLGGLMVNDVHVGPALHKLLISFTSEVPKNLPMGTKMVDLVFNYSSGSSTLVWNNSSNGGTDCEYYGPVGESLPDNPTANYYTDGLVQELPGIVNVNNKTVENGEVECFDATQILNIAGNGTTFIVKNGGHSTLIAGQKIFLFPGTKVHSGGYLEAYITTSGTFCNSLPLAPEIITSIFRDETLSDQQIGGFCKVYPNPTSDKFMVEFDPDTDWGTIHLEIYDLMGEVVFDETYSGNSKMELSLGNKPAGIYLLHATASRHAGVMKIVKY